MATSEEELTWLKTLMKRGVANRIPGFETVGPERTRGIEQQL